ncbi:DUF5926 family protein [Aeromicrobium sp. IC_218]|uniref:DUF5926 family protein n=1 Tax=Aeromicrobium sp. IC_218 TaxID=2545468 RepID=UPI00103BDD3A|nr:DUF5926 family protein [Aeromicrobium sp. IC_218]TCI99332.1 topoisomerase II [Aeromicrobium sp. IC_218]
MGKKSRRIKPSRERMPFVARTFEGLPGECDWVALREIVPAATAQVRVQGHDQPVRVCSLLPGGTAGIRRPDGEVWLGLQVPHNFGDVSRDLAHVLELAKDTEPGNPVPMTDPGVGPRLQDVVEPGQSFDVTVHDGFEYWVEGNDDSAQTAAMLEQANESVAPTVRLDSVEAAYWVQMGERVFLRWVLPHDESPLLDAFARLHVAGADTLGDDTRLLGMFRAHGLLVPVWEMEQGQDAGTIEDPIAALSGRLDEALADTSSLTSEQRSARNGLASRQLTIR